MACKTITSIKKQLNAHEESDQSSKVQLAEILDKFRNLDQINGKRLSVSKWFPVRQGLSKDDATLDEQGIVVASFKMKDFTAHRINETIFHSPPFYTYSHGYKIKVRVQPINNKLSIYAEV